MKISGNFILGLMVAVVVLLGVIWVVSVQVKAYSSNLIPLLVKDKEKEFSVKKGEALFLK